MLGRAVGEAGKKAGGSDTPPPASCALAETLEPRLVGTNLVAWNRWQLLSNPELLSKVFGSVTSFTCPMMFLKQAAPQPEVHFKLITTLILCIFGVSH